MSMAGLKGAEERPSSPVSRTTGRLARDWLRGKLLAQGNLPSNLGKTRGKELRADSWSAAIRPMGGRWAFSAAER